MVKDIKCCPAELDFVSLPESPYVNIFSEPPFSCVIMNEFLFSSFELQILKSD